MAAAEDDHVIREGHKVVLRMGDKIQVATVKLKK